MIKRRIMTLLACICISMSLLSNAVKPASAARPSHVANVLVFSPSTSSPLITSLGVDREAIHVTVLTNDSLASTTIDAFNTTLVSADVIFIDRLLPDNATLLTLLASHVNGTLGNDGLILFGFLQRDSTPGNGDFSVIQINAIAQLLPVNLDTAYVNSTKDSASTDYSIQVKVATNVPSTSDILIRYIPWGTCPLIDRRLVVEPKPGATPVLTDLLEQKAILSEWQLGASGARVMFFAMEIHENNIGFTVFPYFNYLMYACTFHSIHGYSDMLIESWEDWPYSPIPKGPAVLVWFLMIGVLWIITFVIYFKNKKRGPLPPTRAVMTQIKDNKADKPINEANSHE